MVDQNSPSGGEPIYHLAVAAEWDAARSSGEYRRSTIDLSLEEEGFIHASFGSQVRGTADRYYRGRDDIVLLRIDPNAVADSLRVEDLGGTGVSFPHIYGPLPIAAVISARPVPMLGDGTLDVTPLLAADQA